MKSATELYADNPKSTSILNALKKGYDKKTTECLKLYLSTLGAQTAKLSVFRYRLLAVSMTLSDRGIAPYFQNLDKALQTEDQSTALDEIDNILIDLYWLSATFPKHRIKDNGRWNGLFVDGFNIAIASGISDRVMTTSKRRRIIDLSKYQQYGCIALIDTDTKKGRAKFRERSWSVLQKQKIKIGVEPQITEERALYRSRIWLSAKFADCSPQRTADAYKWMTGNTINRANANRAMKKLNLK